MKRLMALAVLMLRLAGSASAVSSTQEALLSSRRASAAFTQDLDAKGLQQFSIQVDLANASPATVSFLGGAKSASELTVTSYDGLIGRKSSSTLIIMSGQNEALSGVYVTVNNRRFTEGIDWAAGYTSTASAAALATALDAYWEYSASASSNVITVLANANGTAANAYTKATSNAAKIAITAWGGGQEHGYLNINGTTLTEATDFTAATSSHTTANAIAVAINANATLAALVDVSSDTALTEALTAGVLTLAAKTYGYNPYYLSVSNTAHLTPQYPQLTGGKLSDVSTSANTITETAHNLPVALGVYLSTGSNLTIGGLTHGATYYVVPVNANSFKLSDTAAHAVAGTDILDLTSAGDATFSLIPQALASAATDGVAYTGSNDGVTFYALSVSSAPYDAAAAGALTQFVDYTGRYVRMTFTPPTTGALAVTATLNGKK